MVFRFIERVQILQKKAIGKMKKSRRVLVILCIIIVLATLFGCSVFDNVLYETSRDEVLESPGGEYTLTLRYDYVSRPFIFKENRLIYEYDGPGFNETVSWGIEWVAENEIVLYYDDVKDEYDEEYYIVIEE